MYFYSILMPFLINLEIRDALKKLDLYVEVQVSEGGAYSGIIWCLALSNGVTSSSVAILAFLASIYNSQNNVLIGVPYIFAD